MARLMDGWQRVKSLASAVSPPRWGGPGEHLPAAAGGVLMGAAQTRVKKRPLEGEG